MQISEHVNNVDQLLLIEIYLITHNFFIVSWDCNAFPIQGTFSVLHITHLLFEEYLRLPLCILSRRVFRLVNENALSAVGNRQE